jgi:hypothetical protein
VDQGVVGVSEDLEPTIVRLRWPGGGPTPSTVLSIRHFTRPLSGNELRLLADIVDAIENFRDEVADPEGIGA